MTELKLLSRERYFRSDKDDPLPMYYLPFFGPLYRGRIEQCFQGLNLGSRILEVGYGSGTTFLNISKLYQEIHGIDLHRHGGAVRNVFDEEGIRTDLNTGDLLNMPYMDSSFDTVLCISILEHLQPSQQPKAMSEIRRVLRPGGRFVYGVPVERPLMQFGFRTLGYDIRQEHFSTEHDVAIAARTHLKHIYTLHYKPLGSLFGSLYETGIYECSK